MMMMMMMSIIIQILRDCISVGQLIIRITTTTKYKYAKEIGKLPPPRLSSSALNSHFYLFSGMAHSDMLYLV